MNPSATVHPPIKRFKPNGPNDPKWEEVKPTVFRVYWDEGCDLNNTMKEVAAKHHFTATKKQWTDKLKSWNLKKNVNTEEMTNIARIQQKRKTEQDKETRFKVRGRLVPMENIERWQKRQKLNNGGFMEVPSWPDAATTPPDISYETPSEAESVPSPSGAPTPRDFPEDADTQSENNNAALALVGLFYGGLENGLSASNLLDRASTSETFPATSGPITPVINTPKAGSPTASDREATPIQNSHQIPTTVGVDSFSRAFHQTTDVDPVDDEDSSSDGSSVLEAGHDEMDLSDSEGDIGSVIMVQEQDYDEAVNNLGPGLLNLAVADARMDAAIPTLACPEFGPDGPLPMVSSEARSTSKRRASDMTKLDMTASAVGFDSAAGPLTAVAPRDDEDNDQTDDQPPRQSSVQPDDPRGETRAPSQQGQRHPMSMTDETALTYEIIEIHKDAEDDGTESLSDDASIAEIDRDDMMYSSDSSDSSIETIDAQNYNRAIRLPQAATNWALLPGQETIAQETKNRALRAAARAGDTQSVQRLIAKGADIHDRSRFGMLALHAAAFHGHVQVVGLLLQLGSDVNEGVRGSVEIPYKYSDTRKVQTLKNPDSLQLACAKGHQHVADLLLSHQPSGIDDALFYAAFFGVDPIVRMLLDWGNQTNHVASDAKERALHIAVSHNYRTTIELLLSGLNSDDEIDLYSALMWAIEEQNRRVCELLLKRGVNMEQYSWYEDTPLTLAIKHGQVEIVKLILEACGGDDVIHHCNDEGETPLTLAIDKREIEIVKLVLDACGADHMNHHNGAGETPLTFAIEKGEIDIVKMVIDASSGHLDYARYNYDLDDSSYSVYNTPLTMAVLRNRKDIVKLLLDGGASIDYRSDDGDTSLIMAVRRGMREMVELLLSRGASMEHTAEDGYTALTYAISHNEAEIAGLLINNGADVRHSAVGGETPLALAFQAGEVEIAKLLLDKLGATVLLLRGV